MFCPLGIVHQFDYCSAVYSQVAKSLPSSESETSGKLICTLAGKILRRRYVFLNLLKSYMLAKLLVSLSFEGIWTSKEIIVEKE